MPLRVGILSMQRIRNYGSFLQAYALKRMFEEVGFDVEFVDYAPGECIVGNQGCSENKSRISKVAETINSGASLLDCLKYVRFKMGFARKYHPMLGVAKEPNANPALDLLVIGSDEVFNCLQDNPDVGFTPQLFGVGLDAKTKVSYAASFGNTTLERLFAYGVADEVAEYLGNLDMISVRDASSLRIVKALLPESSCRIDLDPVLIYGFSEFFGGTGAISQRGESGYMLLYGYSNRFTDEECISIRALSGKKRLPVLCAGGIQGCCDEYVNCSPFELLSLFRDASCIITDTFHGAILSILSHRPFVSFVRREGYGNQEKLGDLLGRMGLSDRIVSSSGLEELERVLSQSIDYGRVDEAIASYRVSAYDYLCDVLLLSLEKSLL